MDADSTLIQDEPASARSAELSRHRKQPPAQVPGFQVLRCLGEGAYGTVWLASEENTGKLVAVKFYTHRRGLDWTLLNREVEKLAVLYTSRNIIGLLDVGWDSDPPYYVMEYLENGSLAAYLEDGPLPPHETVRITKSILLGLVHAHGRGILHCDLKPANVLLDADFEPRLCDFGQSRLSNEQAPALGTLFYMAPEQADLKAIPDARWDVYALGALLYHLLCGNAPYQTPENENCIRAAGTLEEKLAVYRRIVKTSPKPIAHRKIRGVDKRLADIVDRCLQIDPERRFPNAQAILDVLELRERQRSRRPIVTLGFFGPVLLILAMIPVANDAMQSAIQTAENNLTDRALESDAVSVTLLAQSLERELRDRQAELRNIADSHQLRETLQAAETSDWARRDGLYGLLDQQKHQVDTQRSEQGRELDTSWFLNDRVGFQRWRHPRSDTIDQNFTYRDYFNGQDRQYPVSTAPGTLPPITQPHISLAYRGTSERKFKVAISVPVWDLAHERVIGVLARTSELGQLLEDYEDRINSKGGKQVTRMIALVDRRNGQVLDHPWIRRKHQDDSPDKFETFAKLSLGPDITAQLSSLQPHGENRQSAPHDVRLADYDDPVAAVEPTQYRKKWLAAFCAVRYTRWVAIVQEPREDAMQPVDELRAELNSHFWLALLICIGLIGGLWVFVWRIMNERSFRLMTTGQSARPTNVISTVRER